MPARSPGFDLAFVETGCNGPNRQPIAAKRGDQLDGALLFGVFLKVYPIGGHTIAVGHLAEPFTA